MKHQSVGSMAQKDKVAAEHGMSVEEFKAKMKRDRQIATRELKAQLLKAARGPT